MPNTIDDIKETEIYPASEMIYDFLDDFSDCIFRFNGEVESVLEENDCLPTDEKDHSIKKYYRRLNNIMEDLRKIQSDMIDILQRIDKQR